MTTLEQATQDAHRQDEVRQIVSGIIKYAQSQTVDFNGFATPEYDSDKDGKFVTLKIRIRY